jgi:hypothetical protein
MILSEAKKRIEEGRNVKGSETTVSTNLCTVTSRKEAVVIVSTEVVSAGVGAGEEAAGAAHMLLASASATTVGASTMRQAKRVLALTLSEDLQETSSSSLEASKQKQTAGKVEDAAHLAEFSQLSIKLCL